ncbi:MAG: endonuclease/exonuclease/phosphatase family protein, partial [Candidatus Thiodiazotropha taylori]|nr:endonuclease/exonuclease/phosphatase family protein [Candidatus Thiodiazotropha taylori]MCW4286001.1 endonuclease/exonuclease/phosphatase family protein [Candidatus Thiodiazotropha taylori]
KLLIILMPVFILGLRTSNYNVAFQLSLSLQRNCFHSKQIRFPYVRASSTACRTNQKFFCAVVWYFHLISVLWLISLLLLSGDIEINPGPDTSDLSSSYESSSCTDASLLQHQFSLVHYNVQSLRNKIDQIQIELSQFDVVALTETWLSPAISNDTIKMLNYQDPFRKDRQINNYGGVLVYVRENIPCKRRHDLEIQDLESIWLELKFKTRLVLFGLFYRPPNAAQDIYDKIEQSIDLAFDSNNVNDVIVTGDFNLNYLDSVGKNRINQMFTQYSLQQIINEPTHFTETSSTLIDLLFTNHTTNVLLSGVGEPFLDQNVRYHCPIYAFFKFDKHKPLSYKRKIWSYDKGDYDLLRRSISEFDWQIVKSKNTSTYSENVTSKIIDLCEKSIPNKIITVRPSDPPWFNNLIRKSIRKRKRAHKIAKRVNSAES